RVLREVAAAAQEEAGGAVAVAGELECLPESGLGGVPVAPPVATQGQLVGFDHGVGVWVQLAAPGEEFVDLHGARAAPDDDPVDAAAFEVVLDGAPGAFADQDPGAVDPVEAFQATGDVHRVAHRRVVHPALGADVADERGAGVDAEVRLEEETPLRLSLTAK